MVRASIPDRAEQIELGRTIQEWLQHPDGEDGAPNDLRRRGQAAINRLVSGNTRMVLEMAYRFMRRGQDPRPRDRVQVGKGELDDLFQVGCLGLHTAARKFDPSRGYTFYTYAKAWVWQAMQSHACCDGTIRLTRVQGTMAATALGVASRLWAATGRYPTVEEISAQMGTKATPVVVRNCLEARATVRAVVTGDRPLNDGEGCTLLDLQAAEHEDPLEAMEQEQQRADVRAAVHRLPERYRDLLIGLYFQGRPTRDVAAEEGVTTSTIRDRRKLALKALARELQFLPSSQHRRRHGESQAAA